MTSQVIQGSFVGTQPKLVPSTQPRMAAPPPTQIKIAVRPPGPPAPAFARQAAAVQRHGGGGAFAVEGGALGLASGGGRALPEAVRGKMEAALGTDFSNVRVHVGPQAERIGAIAFTIGSDIYFAPGRYQPDTVQGQRLLGHELAHVVQQRAGRVRNPLASGLAVVQDHALEAEADRVGQRAAAGFPGPSGARIGGDRQGKAIQRLLVTIGDAANSGVDFPALATTLIATKTGNKPATMSSIAPPQAGFLASLFGSRPKETLYVCAHGTATGITGYATASGFATALKARGLNDTTLSKIVLVSCIAGGSVPGSQSPVFARALATEMNVDVYAPHDLINVHYTTTNNNGVTSYAPTKFSIRDTDVDVIEGAGLVRFQPSGEGYAPPLPQSTLALL